MGRSCPTEVRAPMVMIARAASARFSSARNCRRTAVGAPIVTIAKAADARGGNARTRSRFWLSWLFDHMVWHGGESAVSSCVQVCSQLLLMTYTNSNQHFMLRMDRAGRAPCTYFAGRTTNHV